MTGIERLRRVAGLFTSPEMPNMLANDLSDIADQIERERACDADAIENIRLIVGGVVDEMERHVSGVEGADDSPVARWARELREALGDNGRDPAADVSMSAYDLLPADERDAIAWVRERGGLDSVKKLLDWVVGHCSTKQQLDFDFWLSGRVMYELGFEEDMADRDEVERRLLARLMPEGMEWPRFEDGEPVHIGDEFAERIYGNPCKVGHFAINKHAFLIFDEEDVNDCEAIDHGNHKRVRRPEPKVLDADGVEVDVGDDLYSVEGMLKFHVSAIDKKRGRIATEAMFALDKWADPKMYTHRAPVLAADGRPLREGETVWSTDSGTRYTVEKNTDELIPIKCRSEMGTTVSLHPSQLTHECPDSFEQLEKDANASTCTYFGATTKDCEICGHVSWECSYDKARDLVRRCRALAERERGE